MLRYTGNPPMRVSSSGRRRSMMSNSFGLRRPDELTRIGGFPVYLSIQSKDLEQQLDWIPKDRTIVTVSNHAARSGRAADLLTARGFKVAGLLGAQTYEEQGGKLTKIEVPPPRTSAPTAAAQPAGK